MVDSARANGDIIVGKVVDPKLVVEALTVEVVDLGIDVATEADLELLAGPSHPIPPPILWFSMQAPGFGLCMCVVRENVHYPQTVCCAKPQVKYH